MRGTIDGLGSPTPIASLLPSLLAGDDFARRWCDGLDEIVAPILSTLDCFPAYLDPHLSPTDMLPYLLSWVGVDAGPDWSEARQRDAVRGAQIANQWLGTIHGLRALIHLRLGINADVADNGGSRGSQTPEPALPGSPQPALVVRVRSAITPTQLGELEALVTQAKPVNVPHRIDILPA